MAEYLIDWIPFPDRPQKPRANGTTMMMDSGMTVTQLEDVLSDYAEYVDYVKFGWGTCVVTPRIAEKVELCRRFGVEPFLGGTFFEVAYRHGQLDKFEALYRELGLTHMELSDGTIEMPRKDKLDAIEQFAKDFKVLSEVGGKDDRYIVAPKIWVERLHEELDAGAHLAITEGREDGNAGLFRQNHEIRTGLVDEIVFEIDPDRVIWEAPTREQQAWFIRRFGPTVNLGNIRPRDLAPLETLRLGLRKDTLEFFRPDEEG